MTRFIPLLLAALLFGCGKPAPETETGHPPQRIVSLAPNITDTLCELELENRLVGISKFSNTATDLPIVGDFLNINYEAIVALRPDLVILEKSADAQQTRLESLGIAYLETGSLSLADIFETIQSIGAVCGADEQATLLIGELNQRMEAARNTPNHRPRTLLTFGGFSNPGEVKQIHAFGNGCIHSEMLEIAGGDNAVADQRPSVLLSREAIIRLNPELIVELTSGGPTNHWGNLSAVDAVKQGRIHVLDAPYTCIPSPRGVIQTLEDLSAIIQNGKSGK